MSFDYQNRVLGHIQGPCAHEDFVIMMIVNAMVTFMIMMVVVVLHEMLSKIDVIMAISIVAIMVMMLIALGSTGQ